MCSYIKNTNYTCHILQLICQNGGLEVVVKCVRSYWDYRISPKFLMFLQGVCVNLFRNDALWSRHLNINLFEFFYNSLFPAKLNVNPGRILPWFSRKLWIIKNSINCNLPHGNVNYCFKVQLTAGTRALRLEGERFQK